jgi:phasin family protein
MAESKPPFDFAELSRRLGELKFPEIDWQELMAAQQKNWEALGQANKVWSEGTRKVVQREVEILQNALAEAAAASRDLLQEGDASAAAEKRLDLAKSTFEKAIGNIRELSEAASRANQDALEVIQKRALAGFDEIKSTIKPKP